LESTRKVPFGCVKSTPRVGSMSAMDEVTMKIVNMTAKKMSIGRWRSGRFTTTDAGA
jgi:hypothetical protein